jgi:hypothetical protein
MLAAASSIATSSASLAVNHKGNVANYNGTSSKITPSQTSSLPLSSIGIASKPRLIRERNVVIAIDFGTSRSGFAFALRSNPSTIATELE